ncbi:MAG: hypothetical protein PHC54_07535 [Candidatus Omnitrophica bacterium]|nr:hypothetical protein [Candidatus Omnitrophota bacterium]
MKTPKQKKESKADLARFMRSGLRVLSRRPIKAEDFLRILFAPIVGLDCLLNTAHEMFRRRYEDIDKTKNAEYVMSSLEEIINDTSSPYPAILTREIEGYLGGNPEEALGVLILRSHELIRELLVSVYLFRERKGLLSWPKEIDKLRRKGKRKAIINAPMGLGKTYQIAKALALSDYSAIVFMPTKKTRDDMFEQIKLYAPEDVLCVIGRDDQNCTRYKKYQKFRKEDFSGNDDAICADCEWYGHGEDVCKKLEQSDLMGKYRIIVTCHAQYPRFHEQFHFIDGKDKEGIPIYRARDYFIIDEDITTGYFLQNKGVAYDDFKEYNDWVQQYPKALETNFKEELNRLDAIYKEGTKPSFVLPTAKGFSLSIRQASGRMSHGEAIKIGTWVATGLKEGHLEYNLTKLIVDGAFNTGSSMHVDKKGKKIYFNDSRVYPLRSYQGEQLPFHVFFDATNVKDTIINRVFPPNEHEIPRIKYKCKPLGKMKYYHVQKTALPTREIRFLGRKVELYLKYVVWWEGGISRFKKVNCRKINYFVVTKKNQYEPYVKDVFKRIGIPIFKDKEHRDTNNYALVGHFGYLRGINDAMNCQVGILLGTWNFPPAVEMVWAMPLMGDKFREKMISKICPNEPEPKALPIEDMKRFVNMGKGVIRNKYKDDFDIIENLSQWKRDAENEQAIGRTRSLFNDATFYIVTKDDVQGYPVLASAEQRIDKIGDEVFQPGHYSNSNYVPVMIVLDRIVKEGRTFTRKEVQDGANKILAEIGESPIKQGAVKKHIDRYRRKNNKCISEYDEKLRAYRVFPGRYVDNDVVIRVDVEEYYDEALDELEVKDKLHVLLSALQKSIRRGEINSARYFAKQMIRNFSPRTVLNRLETMSAEDIGFADPTFASYLHKCYDEFEKCLIKEKISIKQVYKHKVASSIVDRATIAAVLCYKCRLLDCAIWIAWYSIYHNEPFDCGLEEYKELFLNAVQQEDRERALHYAYVISIVFDGADCVFDIIKNIQGRRNEELIDEWIQAYKKARENEVARLLIKRG